MTDPLQLVRDVKPQVDWEWVTSERGQQVMRRSMDLGALQARSLPTRPRRHSRGVIAAAVAGGAAVVTLGAFSFVSLTKADVPTQAGCYARLDPNADMVEANRESVAVVGPVEACAEIWRRDGDVSSDGVRPVACINEDGGRGIFPGPNQSTPAAVCAEIGWQAEPV